MPFPHCAPMIARVALVLTVLAGTLNLTERTNAQAAPTPSAAPPEAPSESAPPAPSAPGPGPRIELSLLSAPFGMYAGLLVCGLAECSDARGFAGSALAGVALGVATSALVTRSTGLEYSTAQAIEGGAFWGLATPVYIWLIANPNADSTTGLFAGMLAGELVGASLGGVIERQLRPTSGAVALANSGSFWLSAITTLATFATTPDMDNDRAQRGLGGGLLAAQVIGLGLGGVIGQRFETRRAQVWLSDVGAVLGGGTMPLLTWLLGGEDVSPAAMLGMTAAGVGVGFAAAYALTEFLPRRKQRRAAGVAALAERTTLAMMPIRQGGGLSLRATLR